MKPLVALILISFFSLFSNAQVDYLDVQDSLFNLSCGDIPMDDIQKNMTNLETFDPSCISKNADIYYKNLGYTYYVYAAKTEDYSYMDKAIVAYTKGIAINSNSYMSHWDIAHCYYFTKDYQSSLRSFEKYKETVPRKFYDRKDIRRMIKECKKKIEANK